MDRMQQQHLKKQLGMPSNARFLGYVLNLPHSDEFLAHYQISPDRNQWAWSATPANAKRFKKLKQLKIVQREYSKYPSQIVCLFETPEQFIVAIPEGELIA